MVLCCAMIPRWPSRIVLFADLLCGTFNCHPTPLMSMCYMMQLEEKRGEGSGKSAYINFSSFLSPSRATDKENRDDAAVAAAVKSLYACLKSRNTRVHSSRSF